VADHPDHATYLFNVGYGLMRRFEHTEAAVDLDEAIDAFRMGVAAAPPYHPARVALLSHFAGSLLRRFELGAATIDLDEAIEAFRAALAATPPDSPAHADCQHNLGIALRQRFERTQTAADLEEAISLGRQAVAAVPIDNPARPSYEYNVGIALYHQFERTGSLDDLGDAVDSTREAAAATPAHHPKRCQYLSTLGGVLMGRFERTGVVADLDEAIDVLRAAATLSPPDYRHQASILSNLGNGLVRRFGRTGVVAYLDEAIDVLREAETLNPSDRSDRARISSNLGVAFQIRFDQTGAMGDLDEAINAIQMAVEATQSGDPERGSCLTNLSIALVARFVRAGALADLESGVEAARQAVNSIPASNQARAGHLSNLAMGLLTRFDRSGDISDLDEAIETFQAAVTATPADHPAYARYQYNLASAFLDRFDLTEAATDLEEAIGRLRDAVATTPRDHPDRATYLSNFGVGLQERFEHNGTLADLEEAVDVFRTAVGTQTAPPITRIGAARGWGIAAASRRDWQSAAEGFAAAVGLLGRVAPRRLNRSDQEYLLAELAGLGSDAAAYCLQADEKERAVELWEQGRAVLLGQALDTRTDLTQLQAWHPQLAAQFSRLRDKLDAIPNVDARRTRMLMSTSRISNAEDLAVAQDEIKLKRKLAEEFDDVVAQIRAQSGFERFLLPVPFAELVVVAERGPVALINVSDIRSDALVLARGDVEVVRLPGLNPQIVRERVAGFLADLDDAEDHTAGTAIWERAEKQLSQTLEWLWDAVANPVLERLGIEGPPAAGEEWKRLWWCPSGLLAFLPLHAAGYHSTRFQGPPQAVLDRVVSSYTPTIRALAYARRPPSTVKLATARQVLVVTMPQTPGAKDLPNATNEAKLIDIKFPDQAVVLTGPKATYDKVVAALQQYQWAHFACHAASDLANPSASNLLLHDYEQKPLSVVDVARLRLDTDLAFLSACGTARTGAQLADEAIHLAAAFQLAGYRHVIATLWPVGDRPAIRIADHVYTTLAAENADHAARALHDATRRRRNLDADRPSTWAAHIYNGA
jgi:tetratricopeptide (TPR) repeat protein